MTNKDKFIEVFGFEPDTETMLPVCPPRGVECPFMDDGIYSECHCELWWGREYKALEQEPISNKDELENSIEMLKILKEQARESGANTFIWDITLESFNFVIDKTVKDLYKVLGDAE